MNVEQVDRDAAADLLSESHPEACPRIRAGEWDHHAYIQAFARHRLAALRDVEREGEGENSAGMISGEAEHGLSGEGRSTVGADHAAASHSSDGSANSLNEVFGRIRPFVDGTPAPIRDATLRHVRQPTPSVEREGVAILREALEQAARWFEGYAVDHEVKARQASDSGEQASRRDKAKRNQERADFLREALAKADRILSLDWRGMEKK